MNNKGKEEMTTVGIKMVELGTLGVSTMEENDLNKFNQNIEEETVALAALHEQPPILGQAHSGPAVMQEIPESDSLDDIFRFIDEQLSEINRQFEKAATDRKIEKIKMDNAELEEQFKEKYQHLQALCNDIKAIADLKPKNSQWRDTLHKVYYYTEGLPSHFERAKKQNLSTLNPEHTRYLLFTVETRTAAIEKLVNDHQNSVSEMRKEHLKKVLIENTGKNPINYVNNRAHSVKNGALTFKISVEGFLAAITTSAKETFTKENYENTSIAMKEGILSAWNSFKTHTGTMLETAKTFFVDQYAAAKSWISDKWNSLTNRSSVAEPPEPEEVVIGESSNVEPEVAVKAPDALAESLRKVLKHEDSSTDLSEYSYEETDHTGEFHLLDGFRHHEMPHAELEHHFTMEFEEYVNRICANDDEIMDYGHSPIKD